MGVCSGKLEFVGRFNADGTLAATREAKGFSLFVRTLMGVKGPG
jgi:hypothetical protein